MRERTNLIAAQLLGELEYWCSHFYEQVQPHCYSPVECLLGAAIMAAFKMAVPIELCTQEQATRSKASLVLIPQFKWTNYRIDWVVNITRLKSPHVFIECDGHDFHERTKEQAAHDKKRDRAIQASNIPIMRFTGS